MRLAQALEWAASHQHELNINEREFLSASQALAECEAIEKEVQRQREVESARKLAETEGKRAEEQALASRLLRKRSRFLAAASFITLVMAIVAGFLGWRAHVVSRQAASRELAAAAVSNLEIDAERSTLLAMEAVSLSYTLEAENALHQSILASRVQKTIPAFDSGTVSQIAYRPDGSQLAAASAEEMVKVWDLPSGQLLYTVTGHSAAYSPIGDRLATVLADGTVKLWDARSGGEISLPSPITAGEDTAFSPDGSRLATVTPVNLPRIWDLETGEELMNFPGHTDYVSHVIFSPGGNRLLTTSDDGTARLWDVGTGQQVLSLSGHPSIVWTAAFSPDEKRILTASEAEAYVWDAVSGEKLLTLSGHTGTIYAVAFSPDGKQLATGGLDRKVKLWDAETGRELFTLSGHAGAVTSLAFDPSGTQLATVSDDGFMKIWSLAPGQEWLALPAGAVHQVFFSPGCDNQHETAEGPCQLRLVGIGESHATIWNVLTGKEFSTLRDQGHLSKAAAFSPDGTLIITAGDDLHIKIWDSFSGTVLHSWPAHTGLVNAVALHPKGTYLVTASDDYKVKVWDLSHLEDKVDGDSNLSRILDLPSGAKSLDISLDGERLAAGLDNGTVRVWNFSTWEEQLTLRGHTNSVVSVSFSPDGKQIATASLDGTARIWDAENASELMILSGHNSAVTAVKFSPDGKRIATASLDGYAKLWDARSGQEQLTLPGNGMGLTSVAFSPDGKWFATSGDSGVRVYLLDIDDLVALARTRVTRTLSNQECQKYLHRLGGSCQPPMTTATAIRLQSAANGRICQLANTGSLYDRYFISMMYKGVEDSAKMFGWEATALQSGSPTDYGKNLQTLTSADCHLIVAPVAFFDEIQNAAEANPDEKFMMMDFVYNPPLRNIWNQVYATDQAAFLSGYLAASVTRTGKVGVFGGLDIPQVTDFMDGFALGVAHYNKMKDAHVDVLGWDVQNHEGLFVGGFCCTSEGRQMAQQLLNEGVDVILPVAGKTVGWGAGAEVQNHGNAWLIGVDTDWSVSMPEFADIVLTSIEKRFDVSVINAAKAISDGTFDGGIHLGTLETGEVDISPFHNLGWLISSEFNKEIENIRADIIAGRIRTKP